MEWIIAQKKVRRRQKCFIYIIVIRLGIVRSTNGLIHSVVTLILNCLKWILALEIYVKGKTRGRKCACFYKCECVRACMCV